MPVRVAGVKRRRRGHDSGRVICDLAVMLAERGECVSDLASVREQDGLFRVASDSTAFGVIDRIASEPGMEDALCSAHAAARARFWELDGAPGRLRIAIDVTLITARSEKENAAGQTPSGLGAGAIARCCHTVDVGLHRSAGQAV